MTNEILALRAEGKELLKTSSAMTNQIQDYKIEVARLETYVKELEQENALVMKHFEEQEVEIANYVIEIT